MQRIAYLDNLRALAMLAGVVFHAALAYSPIAHPYFPTADRAQSAIVDVVIWFFHLFRMPLFFVVAGFFAALLISKRGLPAFFRHRCQRIVLPFIVFWPLVYAALYFSTKYAAISALHPSPVLAQFKQFLALPDAPVIPPSTSHLWFLYYLMFFYILIWSFRQFNLSPLRAIAGRMQALAKLVLLPLLLVPALVSVTAPHPAPDSFLPQFWAFGFFGIFFALGYQLFHHDSAIDELKPLTTRLLLASIALYLLFLYLLEQQQNSAYPNVLPWFTAIVEAYISAWMVVFCLIAGKTWLNRSSAGLRYIADSSYWVYIVHLPILFVVQYGLMDRDLYWGFKFLIACVATLGLCWISYHLLVRRSAIGRLLNGKASTDFSAPPQTAKRE